MRNIRIIQWSSLLALWLALGASTLWAQQCDVSEFPLSVDFNDRTVGQPIGAGGAAAGEPTTLGSLTTLVEEVSPGENLLLVSNDLSSTSARRLRWQLASNAEITEGQARISFDFQPEALDSYSILVREANTSGSSFLTLFLLGNGNMSASDGTGAITLETSTYSAELIHVELLFDLDAGTSEARFNGQVLFRDRPYGVVGDGVGALLVGYSASSNANPFRMDNLVIESRPALRTVLDANFDALAVGGPIGTGGAVNGEPFSATNGILTEIVAISGADNGVQIESPSTGSAFALVWQFLDDVEIRSGSVVIEMDVFFSVRDSYAFGLRESGSSGTTFANFRLSATGAGFIADGGGTTPLAGFSYLANQTYELRFEFDMGNGTYDVFWDGEKVVSDREHGVVNGRGVGRLITQVSAGATTGGPMRINNLRVSATEASQISTELAILVLPISGFVDRVLMPPLEVGAINAFDEPVCDDAAVSIELAVGPAATLSGENALTVAGTATFGALSIDTPGNYVLRALSGDVEQAASMQTLIAPLPDAIFRDGMENP